MTIDKAATAGTQVDVSGTQQSLAYSLQAVFQSSKGTCDACKVHTAGNEAIQRTAAGAAAAGNNAHFVQIGRPLIGRGVVTAWRVWTAAATTITCYVWRPSVDTDSDGVPDYKDAEAAVRMTKFTLIGKSTFSTSTAGFHEKNLQPSERINFEEGDMLGWSVMLLSRCAACC